MPLTSPALNLEVDHQLLDFSLDYAWQGRFRDAENQVDLAQSISSSLRSSALNDLLAAKAVLRMASVLELREERYRHQLSSEFSRALSAHVNLDIHGSYTLKKPSRWASEQLTTDYSIQLDTELLDGRLAMTGTYRETFKRRRALQNTLTAMDIDSRYHVGSGLQLDLSGTVMRTSGTTTAGFEQQRLQAGISWSPASDYDVSFRLNRREDTRIGRDDIFGSGSIIWSPELNWQLEFRYDDYLVEDMEGILFRARIDLGPG
ncbi:hypothetical protein CWI75_01225 [Kineobactrum sediminis]|uniref:DUF560 domain-containing protein n=1 Tax=Kineobactrum sediminis TaxID=1905677 RepID=A0A2N5Y6H7_9GAMM|nr:hypothetical protein CWI75_01225 [Kineobactrum sediminis]